MAQHSLMAEKYLLNTLERIAKNSSGYAVLYISVSKLRPKHRHPKFLKILEKFFDSVVGETKGAFFPMSNGDFVILGRDITQNMADDAVDKLRAGLSNDPILHGRNRSEFATVFSFPEAFASFYAFVANLIESNAVHSEADDEDAKRPVEAGEVDSILQKLERTDISELVKRQSVVKVLGPGQFKVYFQEFFVAVKDLNLLFDGLDLEENRWLYLYMLQNLDRRMLQAFFSANLQNWPNVISINLNLSSVFSSEFVRFGRDFLKQGHKIIVEVQLIDVFNNLPLYFEVKDILSRGGHRILIDGVNAASLRMINMKNLNPDLVKIFWEPLLEFEPENEDVKKLAETLGRDNVILAKCDTSAALQWGVKHGLSVFQGPFVDDIEVSYIYKRCPNAKNCQIKECLKRKRLLSGAERDKCICKEILEDLW